jgi:hypothetical protein
MEVDLDKQTNCLRVSLTDEECLAIVSGGIFSSITRSPIVEIHPLSEINPTSRALKDKDGRHVKKQLGSLCSFTSVNSFGEFTIYIPEVLAQSAHVNAEHLHWDEVKRESDEVGKVNVRIELGLQDPLFQVAPADI